MKKLKSSYFLGFIGVILLVSSSLSMSSNQALSFNDPAYVTTHGSFTANITNSNSPAPAATQFNSFPVGSGFTDVVPHQIVRANNDKVYIFAVQAQFSTVLKAYWTNTPGLPTTSAEFSGTTQVTESEQPISVDAVYDGANFIHVLLNTHSGNLKDYVFDISQGSFRTAYTIGSDSASLTGDYIGTSGVSGMFDTTNTLHLAYWSTGNHIIYRAYTYNGTTATFTLVSGPTQLEVDGKSNHPSVAISPLDNSVNIGWVSEFTSPAQILFRSKPAGGSWSTLIAVSNAPVWISTSSGLNIDQGPSLVVDSLGKKHLTYIQNFDSTGDYGRIHYVTDTTGSWVDTALLSYTHDPALALNSYGELYIIGHGHPNNLTCKAMEDMCVIKKNNNGGWDNPTLFALHPANSNFDASPSVKWSVIGFNRPETIEFLFFRVNNGSYNDTTVYYANLISNPGPAIAPRITSLTPYAANAGSATFTLTVSGSGFEANSEVRWNGSSRPTTFVSSTQLTAQINAADIAAPGSSAITVLNLSSALSSNSVTFFISGLCAQVTSSADTNTCGTLRYAVANANGSPVTFANSINAITLLSTLNVPNGVKIFGDCHNRIQLNVTSQNKLQIGGNNTIQGLSIFSAGSTSGFVLKDGQGANTRNNSLKCMSVKRTS